MFHTYCFNLNISYQFVPYGNWVITRTFNQRFEHLSIESCLQKKKNSGRVLRVLPPRKWTSNWETVGNWPILLAFPVVQFNFNLFLGQTSVHSVQWLMTWAKRLPSLSCLSTLVVATTSEPTVGLVSGSAWWPPCLPQARPCWGPRLGPQLPPPPAVWESEEWSAVVLCSSAECNNTCPR